MTIHDSLCALLANGAVYTMGLLSGWAISTSESDVLNCMWWVRSTNNNASVDWYVLCLVYETGLNEGLRSIAG